MAALQVFGAPHLTVLALVTAMGVGLPLWVRRSRQPWVGPVIRGVLAVGLPLNELQLCAVVLFWSPTANVVSLASLLTHFLPVHICPMAAFLIAWTLWRRTQWTYELAYFWAMAGTAQALLTPNLGGADYPSYWFFQFFTSHGGTVVAVLVATVGMRMRPRSGSVPRVFLWTNLYLLWIAFLTWRLNVHGLPANYAFLRAPPDGQTLLSALPWPWYLLLMEPLGLGLFLLAYLPFWVRDRRARRRQVPAKLAL
jgi:hypothetical integral membrane protein (TIGR02206 family)